MDYLTEALEEESVPTLSVPPPIGGPSSRATPSAQTEEEERTTHAPGEFSTTDGRNVENQRQERAWTGEAVPAPYWDGPSRETPTAFRPVRAADLLAQKFRRAERMAPRVRGIAPGPAVTVTAPAGEAAAGLPSADLLALDRAVQRDARRYDSGFSLY